MVNLCSLTPLNSGEYGGVCSAVIPSLSKTSVIAFMFSPALSHLKYFTLCFNPFNFSMTFCTNRLGLGLSTRKEKPPATFWNPDETKWIPYLQPFGRIGIVTTKKSFKAKLKEKGTKMIMVGYAHNHPRGTYRLYNPAKQSVITSRDIYWHDYTPYNPTLNLSIFVQDPALKIITNGLDEHKPITQDNYTPTITQKHDDDEKTKTKDKMPESPQIIPVLDAGRQNDEKQNEKTSRTRINEEN